MSEIDTLSDISVKEEPTGLDLQFMEYVKTGIADNEAGEKMLKQLDEDNVPKRKTKDFIDTETDQRTYGDGNPIATHKRRRDRQDFNEKDKDLTRKVARKNKQSEEDFRDQVTSLFEPDNGHHKKRTDILSDSDDITTLINPDGTKSHFLRSEEEENEENSAKQFGATLEEVEKVRKKTSFSVGGADRHWTRKTPKAQKVRRLV